MRKRDETTLQIRNFVLIGMGLFCIVFFAPNAAHHDGDSFIKIARSSPWNHFFDLMAAWCSLKIVFLSGGVYVLATALGKVLEHWRHRDFGWIEHNDLTLLVFSLQVAAAIVFVVGDYYFIKALL